MCAGERPRNIFSSAAVSGVENFRWCCLGADAGWRGEVDDDAEIIATLDGGVGDSRVTVGREGP